VQKRQDIQEQVPLLSPCRLRRSCLVTAWYYCRLVETSMASPQYGNWRNERRSDESESRGKLDRKGGPLLHAFFMNPPTSKIMRQWAWSQSGRQADPDPVKPRLQYNAPTIPTPALVAKGRSEKGECSNGRALPVLKLCVCQLPRTSLSWNSSPGIPGSSTTVSKREGKASTYQC
jgi:hypothetical protein